MIDALIGAVIAVIATSALTLLAEVMTNVEAASKSYLTDYEKSVFNIVKNAHPPSSVTEDSLLDWMNQSARSDEL